MKYFKLKNLDVVFPIYNATDKSIKRAVARIGSGKISHKGKSVNYVHALKNLNLEIKDGDRIGLIGPNGAGKSTLLRVLGGIYYPSSGHMEVGGKVTPLLDIHLGMDPDMTGYENIVLRGMFLGFSKKQIQARVDEIADFSELGDYLNMPIRVYSDGMKLRLAFSVSTGFTTEILLMDESILVGDARFIERARKRIEQFIYQSNIFVIASHSNDIIKKFCNKALFLNSGSIQEFGETVKVIKAYEKWVKYSK